MNLDNTNQMFQSYFNNYRCQQTQPTTYQTQTQQDQIQLPNRNSRVDITITTNKYTLSDLRNGDDAGQDKTLVKKLPATDHENAQRNGDNKAVPPMTEDTNGKEVVNSSSTGDTSPFDEKKEWAKISEIMESFGSGIARESVFMEDEFKKQLVGKDGDSGILDVSLQTPLQAFLNGIGLIHLAPLLEESGFDNVDFLVSCTSQL